MEVAVNGQSAMSTKSCDGSVNIHTFSMKVASRGWDWGDGGEGGGETIPGNHEASRGKLEEGDAGEQRIP
jgi:hypothetical protein